MLVACEMAGKCLYCSLLPGTAGRKCSEQPASRNGPWYGQNYKNVALNTLATPSWPLYSRRLDKAIRQAALAHGRQGQVRKGTELPYIIHPFGVMLIAATVTADEDVLIACLMHDVLEDVEPAIYDADQMERDFGQRVRQLVGYVTKDASIADWHAQCQAYLKRLTKAPEDALIIAAADKIHNLTSVLVDRHDEGRRMWQRFTVPSPAVQLQWYQSVLNILTARLPGCVLGRQLAELISELKQLPELEGAAS